MVVLAKKFIQNNFYEMDISQTIAFRYTTFLKSGIVMLLTYLKVFMKLDK